MINQLTGSLGTSVQTECELRNVYTVHNLTVYKEGHSLNSVVDENGLRGEVTFGDIVVELSPDFDTVVINITDITCEKEGKYKIEVNGNITSNEIQLWVISKYNKIFKLKVMFNLKQMYITKYKQNYELIEYIRVGSFLTKTLYLKKRTALQFMYTIY